MTEKYGIGEIICPICNNVHGTGWDDTEGGSNMREYDYQCAECGEFFLVKSEIYFVEYRFYSATYDTVDRIKDEGNKRIINFFMDKHFKK